MTRDEILALQPSPELDALVAEKVLGCKVVRALSVEAQVYGEGWPGQNYATCGCPYDGPVRPHASSIESPVAPYSHQPWAAWAVVENLRERFDCVAIICEYDEWVCGQTTGTDNPTIAALGTDWQDVSRQREPLKAPTMPLAICRAALLTVEWP